MLLCLPMKHCNRCQQNKPFSDFYKDSSSKDLCFSWCKECSKRFDKERRLAKKLSMPREPKETKPLQKIIPQSKTCSFCNEEKGASCFGKSKSNSDGLRSECKTCIPKKYPHLYNRERYKGKYKEYSQKYYWKNREIQIEKARLWAINNKEKAYLSHKKYASKPKSRIKNNLRKRMKALLSAKDISYDCSVGCTRKELMSHLGNKMLIGMTWENYGKLDGWCVDHIKPLESFDLTKKEERNAANNFKNLQPLWRSHNEKKSNNYDPDHPMGWHGLDELLSEEDRKLLSERHGYDFGKNKTGDSQI